VKVQEKDGLIIIEPRFQRADSNRSLLYIEVTGASGGSKRYIIQVSGSTGQITAQEAKDLVPLFDLPQDASSPDEPAAESAGDSGEGED
jgi:hypothetical protein